MMASLQVPCPRAALKVSWKAVRLGPKLRFRGHSHTVNQEQKAGANGYQGKHLEISRQIKKIS